MNEVEKTGKTVEEAVEAALQELGVGREAVEVEVIGEDEGRGFFGFLRQKGVRVRVKLRPDKGEFAAEFLRELGDLLELPLKVTAAQGERHITVKVEGEDLGLLIGRRGQTLQAVQFLVNVITSRKSVDKKFIMVDVQNYRERREQMLGRLAQRMADKAVRLGKEVALDPMNAQERRMVHVALQDDPRVQTASRGEEPFRSVVIIPVS